MLLFSSGNLSLLCNWTMLEHNPQFLLTFSCLRFFHSFSFLFHLPPPLPPFLSLFPFHFLPSRPSQLSPMQSGSSLILQFELNSKPQIKEKTTPLAQFILFSLSYSASHHTNSHIVLMNIELPLVLFPHTIGWTGFLCLCVFVYILVSFHLFVQSTFFFVYTLEMGMFYLWPRFCHKILLAAW